jgi:hypothetical protein
MSRFVIEERPVKRSPGLALSEAKGLTATPNPFTSFATVPGRESERFALYDISGRKVGVYKGDRIGEGLAPKIISQSLKMGRPRPLYAPFCLNMDKK